MNRITKTFIAAVLVLSLCIIPTGCGGKAAESKVSTFTLGSSVAFDTMNPLTSYMQVTKEFFQLIYDPLVNLDANWKPIPCLATDWSVSDDNLTWTFHLQKGVKWSDGEPFTSADVKYTYDTMIRTGLGSMYNSYLTNITDIQCPDDLTVVIKSSKPKANMLMNTTPILPKHILSKMTDDKLSTWTNAKPVGTGAYTFDSKGDNFIKIIKNKSYFGAKPSIDEFVFTTYENTDALAQSLMLGEIDGATNLNPAQLKELKADKNVNVISGQEQGFMQIGVNCWTSNKSKGNPLLKDKYIRQAIELAINKQNILDMAYYGQGAVGTTLINPGTFYHYEPTDAERRDYDPAAAKTLLAKTGYKDTNGDGILESASGKPLSFNFITIGDNVEEVKSGQMIEADCAKVGIKINNTTMDSGALQDKILAGDYDMFIWGWGADVDPAVITGLITTSQLGASNETFFTDPKYDELFDKQNSEMDENARQKEVFELQKIAYDEAPYIILYYTNNIQAIRSDRWTGYKQIPDDGLYFFNMTNENYINMKPVE